MAHQSYKDASRSDWGREGGTSNLEELKFGLLQRIAESLEAMSKNYVSLLRDVEGLRESRDRAFERENRLERTISGLRGALTKAKKKESP